VNSGAQTAADSGVIPANAIAGAAIAACVIMAMGVGAYMLYKHKNAAQRNLMKSTTPTVQTINPASIKCESFRIDPRVAFKPIKSARSFSV
jgi:negative regulator of sigma E activity